MSYFIRLARRAAGLSHGNSLRPNVRGWNESFDPFENVVIRPLAYPDTSNRQGPETHPASKREDALIPRQNHQQISDAQKPDLITVAEVTRQDGREPFRSAEPLTGTKADSTAVTRHSKQRPPLKQTGKAARRDLTDNTNPLARETETALTHQQSVKIPQQRAENEGLEISKLSRPQLFHRLADKAVASRQVTTKPRPARQHAPSRTAPTKGLEVLTPGVQRVEPSHPTSPVSAGSHRRKPPAAQTAVAPRLIIGSLKVDVVPVTDKTKQRPSTQLAKRQQKKNRKHGASRQAVKMRFGLGQM